MESDDESPTLALLDGRYQLQQCVGQGGMARVYRAIDLLLERTVAIKVVRTDADNLSSPGRMRTEMTVLASLNHPSLVTLLDGSAVPGRTAYLVMEFVDGATLGQQLRDGPLAPTDAAHLACELASALQTVHASGIVHRDVKPSNVLLAPATHPDRRYLAKLADFGVAYLLDSSGVTSPGMVVGTAAYLAPEQVRGEPVTTAADIYALGLVLLESLTGERAFAPASGIGAVMARLIDPPSIPGDFGPQWSELLGRMTSRDPALRPTAGEVAQAAAEIAPVTRAVPVTRSATVPVASAVPDASGESLPTAVMPGVHALPPARRRTRVVAAVGAAALAIACTVVAMQVGLGDTQTPTTRIVETEPVIGETTEPAAPDTEQVSETETELTETEPTETVVEQVDAPDEAPAPPAEPSDKAERDAEKAAEKAQRDAEKAEREAEKAAEQERRREEKARG